MQYSARAEFPVESNRAKPPDEGSFVPARHWAQRKIPGLGQTMLARAAHLGQNRVLILIQYFYSAWFSLGNDSPSESEKKSPNWVTIPRCAWGGAFAWQCLVRGEGVE